MKQELRVTGVVAQQPLEFLPRHAIVAGSLIGLCQADRQLATAIGFAAAALQTLQELVEVVCLKVEIGQLGDVGELVIELHVFFERLPKELNRFIGAELAGERVAERDEQCGLVRVDSRRPPQRRQSVLRPIEPEAKVGKELIRLDVARRGGDELAPRLVLHQCGLAASQVPQRALSTRCERNDRRQPACDSDRPIS